MDYVGLGANPSQQDVHRLKFVTPSCFERNLKSLKVADALVQRRFRNP